jgi:RNAse (barnase) inhibitor barstar
VNETAGLVYEIDGERILDTDGFYTMIGEAVNGPGGYFGRGLDSLNDCLRGGFGAPEDGPFSFVWRNSRRSRIALGYPETVRQLERRLARCHPSNRPRVQQELASALRGEGSTVFDWIVGVFADQQVPLDLQ